MPSIFQCNLCEYYELPHSCKLRCKNALCDLPQWYFPPTIWPIELAEKILYYSMWTVLQKYNRDTLKVYAGHSSWKMPPKTILAQCFNIVHNLGYVYPRFQLEMATLYLFTPKLAIKVIKHVLAVCPLFFSLTTYRMQWRSL